MLLDQFFASPAGRAYFAGWRRPTGSSVAFLLLSSGESADAFCRRVLEATGILLLPGSTFLPGTDDQGKRVRFGFGRENMREVRGGLLHGHPYGHHSIASRSVCGREAAFV